MKRQRFASAGQALAVAVVCFATWLLLDAHKLYGDAFASPLGARRDVALAFLRPLNRASQLVGLEAPVRGADQALGRGATPGGSVGGLPGRFVTAPDASSGGSTPAPSPSARAGAGGATPATAVVARALHTTTSTVAPTPTTSPAGPPALRTPSAAHPLTVLDIGDSIGEDLGFGLGDVLANEPYVHVIQDAVGSTGLAAVGYYDWPAELEVELTRYHPQVVVVMLGGNDAQNFAVGNEFVGFGTALWRNVYGARVATMMHEATAAGAHVLWVGMPQMAPDATLSSADMAIEDSVYRSEGGRHPGVTYLSTWQLLADSAGQYSEYLPDVSGSLVQVRDSDGIHVDAPGGTDRLAAAALRAMEHSWHVRL